MVVIDIQNDITKHYKDIIDHLNSAIDWAVDQGIPVVYIRHEILSEHARKFLPGTPGVELVPELRVVSDLDFVKHKGSALTSEEFSAYVEEAEIEEFYVTGADATQCVKSTCFNMRKAGYEVVVLADCIASWDPKKIPEMLRYYESKGCRVMRSDELPAGRS